MSYLRELKNQIKSEPIILLKKPWLVFLIPVLPVYIIANRFKSSLTLVYLTESQLDQFLCKNTFTTINEKNFKVISSFDGFREYAQNRIMEEVEQGDLLVKVIKKRFKRGDFAIIYTDKSGNPLSHVFIGTDNAVFTPVGITLKMPEKTFSMYDVYTYEGSRGKGHYSCLFNYAVYFMKSKGYEKMWLWLMKHNEVSVKVHYKLGIRMIIKILTERLKAGIITRKTEDVDMLLSELIVHE